MKLLKLTALTSLCFALFLGFSSCEKDAEKSKVNVYTRTDIPMNGAQAVPANASTGNGTLSVYYDKRVKILYYTITWAGLTGVPTSIGIFGPAPAGYLALTSAGAPAPALQAITITNPQISGTYSGTLFVDDVKIVEQTLINGLFYVRIATAANPLGEIRAQIKFL
jgi:hypothetical protein